MALSCPREMENQNIVKTDVIESVFLKLDC